eukprot:13204205-Heterocapsa_arctica.AAC.1
MARMRDRIVRCWDSTEEWAKTAAERQWIWAGTIANMSADRWARRALEWNPRRTEQPIPSRSPGRPRL